MPTPAAQHPDHGCHHELAIGRLHVHACNEHWMEPIAAVAVAELPDPGPPTDLIVRAEQKRRADITARKAKRRNRSPGRTAIPLYPHGSASGYERLRCSCDDCRKWNRDLSRRARARMRASGLPESDSRHGTRNGYSNYGCRCMPCIEANKQYQIAWRDGRR